MTESETTVARGNWFEPVHPSSEAAARLFLFPHAGSGAIIYRDWANPLPPDIAQQAVTLAGRHQRDEGSHHDWSPLLEALLEVIAAELDDRPFAFFGRCLGAQLAYRLTVRLHEESLPGPVLLGVSGWASKWFFDTTDEQVNVPEAEMIEWIKRLGFFPASVYDNPEMLALVIPALRADLAVCARYTDDGASVPCPIVSYSGRADPLMEAPAAMTSWVPRTPRYLGHSESPGGYFYIDRHASAVVAPLTGHLHRLLERISA